MAQIRLTIQELKRQQDDLKRYQRYLPTLVLKKLQIQIELNKTKSLLEQKKEEEKDLLRGIHSWVPVLGEEIGILDIIQVEAIDVEKSNVAGVEIPVFKRVLFKRIEYDLYAVPLWVDKALEELKNLIVLKAEKRILKRQVDRLKKEMRTTIQRVNLFEKIKIPEAREHIRLIRIFLGDQQTAAVVRGKIAKQKVINRVKKENIYPVRLA